MKAGILVTASIITAGSPSALARAEQPGTPTGTCAQYAPEAARRAGISADIVLRVMHVESRGDPAAVSPKGAIGCMQIMPATWRYLTARYTLGSDPFAPRMNMIGGALYLAELAAQFGMPGAWAAYNAGPARYRRYLTRGVRLPAETVAYTAQIAKPLPRRNDSTDDPRWQDAGLFMARDDDRPNHSPDTIDAGLPAAFPVPETIVHSGQSSLFPLSQTATSQEE